MADRDLTPGELGVRLDGIAAQLDAIANTMLTRQVFDVWNHGIDQRFVRTEDRQREIEVNLANLRTEHQAEIDKAKNGLRADLKEIRDDREADKKDIEQFKRSRFNSVLLVFLTVPVTVITTVVTKFLWPG